MNKKKYRKRKIGNPSSFTNQETIPTNESNQVNSQKGKRYKSEKMNYDENKYKSEKINFEKKKHQSEKIDFNEKISFNENEYRKTTKMGPNSFTAAVNEDLKIYKFENPAGRNLCFSNAVTTVILNIQGISQC